MSHKLDDYNYDLPEEYIAQQPIYPRDHSKLMVVKESSDKFIHKNFFDIIDFLSKGDILVVNNSKVIPARLHGKKVPTGGKVEALLLKKRKEENVWECLVKPARRLKVGQDLSFGNDQLKAKIIEELPEGRRLIKFEDAKNIDELIDKVGEMPLPPYIKEELENKDRYQTVYAKWRGSAAAPTAGLHFTDELIEKIEDKGIIIAEVMLHVGLGTFRPVDSDDITKHIMHSEYYEINNETAEKLNDAKRDGKKIVAVGTTSIRVLESAANEEGLLEAKKGKTDIFIYPGYEWKFVNSLITNFHLPKSSLLMLVSAFIGRDKILKAYEEAKRKSYRFFSFGDAMFLTRRN
ncbi:MAG: tRNA preQ1(34) S-adenosylmethionine ribosyltransferase-isomerase QueA [Clostridia bacterium]